MHFCWTFFWAFLKPSSNWFNWRRFLKPPTSSSLVIYQVPPRLHPPDANSTRKPPVEVTSATTPAWQKSLTLQPSVSRLRTPDATPRTRLKRAPCHPKRDWRGFASFFIFTERLRFVCILFRGCFQWGYYWRGEIDHWRRVFAGGLLRMLHFDRDGSERRHVGLTVIACE